MPSSNLARALPEEAAVRYAFDAQGSTFIVQASSTGLLSAFGHSPRLAIREFQGEVEFTPGAPSLDDAHVWLRIRADSLEVVGDISEKDRQEIQRRARAEVLESDRFAEIVYDCSKVSGNGSGNRLWATLNGELSLHGVTQPQPVTARVVINGSSLRASGEFTVRQTDYDIRPVTAAAGTIKLKDELKCMFDIVARKRE